MYLRKVLAFTNGKYQGKKQIIQDIQKQIHLQIIDFLFLFPFLNCNHTYIT